MTDQPASGRQRTRAPVPDPAVLESPLSASWRPSVRERAVLVGIGPGIAEEDLDELAALADSAGAEPVARLVQSRSEPDPATWIGRGKMEELHRLVHAGEAPSWWCSIEELTPGHLRTLESRLGVKVIDRTALILDIFALHARSREGKAQVELAQLNYLLPTAPGLGRGDEPAGWRHRDPTGPGETKLEMDRQHIATPHLEAAPRHPAPGEDSRHEASDAARTAASLRWRSPATRTPASPR